MATLISTGVQHPRRGHIETRFAEAENAILRPQHPLTVGELESMCLAGVVRPTPGNLYLPTGIPDTPIQRAAAVWVLGRNLFGVKWAAMMQTAAWIHCGGTPPRLWIDVAVNYRNRRPRPATDVALRIFPYNLVDARGPRHTQDSVREPSADLITLGAMHFTGVELTVVHLLIHGHDDADLATVKNLLEHCEVGDIVQRLRSHHSKELSQQGLSRLADLNHASTSAISVA